MNRGAKKIYITAAILFAVGAVIFLGALVSVDFEPSKFSTQKYETKTVEFYDDFENIIVEVEDSTVTFVPSEEEVCKVECLERENLKHSAKIQEGTLRISYMDNRKWHNYLGINYQSPAVTVYLPKEEYTSLFVETSSGDVEIPDGFRFETVEISGTTSNITCYAPGSTSVELNTSSGDITLRSMESETVRLSATSGIIRANDVSCNKMIAKSSSGDIQLENVLAKMNLKVESTTGEVELEDCDSTDITIKTSTGDVEGTLLSEKIFIIDTSTGRVEVPKTSSGGRCEITTNTGDIEIEIE